MLEYKREKSTLEQRLDTVEKKAADHDDHIRYVDAWWLQVGAFWCPDLCVFAAEHGAAAARSGDPGRRIVDVESNILRSVLTPAIAACALSDE
jgi:hypothetical protein